MLNIFGVVFICITTTRCVGVCECDFHFHFVRIYKIDNKYLSIRRTQHRIKSHSTVYICNRQVALGTES